MDKHKSKIMIVMGVVIALVLGLISFKVIQVNKQNEIDSNMEVKHDKEYVIEYGDEFDFDIIRALYEEELYEEQAFVFTEVKNNNTVEDDREDTEQEDEVTDEENEADKSTVETITYEFEVRKTKMTFDVIVKDTQMPTMTGETTFKTEEGKDVDYKKIVAEDKVDGELEVTYEGEVDIKTPGEYKVIAKAVDKNGNEVTETIVVTVTKKVVVEAPKPPVNNNTNKKPSGNGGSTANNSKPKPPANNNSGNNSGGNGGNIFDIPYKETLTFHKKVIDNYYNEVTYFWYYQKSYLSAKMNIGTCDDVRFMGADSYTPVVKEMVEKSEAMCKSK